MTIAVPTLQQYLRTPLKVGDPDIAGPLAVFPLFGPEPDVDYLAFAEALDRGVTVRELEGIASVDDLAVVNPTDHTVLLYDGEEVLGAQQNRTFDVSVLVAAGTRLQVPVSCVEHGRWDGSRHNESFSPAPQAAYPELRKMKNRQARAAAAQGLEARADQSAVWSEVSVKAVRMGVGSPTDAMHDIYEGRRDRLSLFRDAIQYRDGQTGALVCVAGQPS